MFGFAKPAISATLFPTTGEMMPETSKLVRFGVFELDLSSGELFKSGRRLRLQEQPFRILSLLLEQPGGVTTRERLKQTLWPADTFVDFDRSLNAAIAKLRQVLGDSAENPRFIETVARRGYRFIAPIDRGSIDAPPVPIAPAKNRTGLAAAITIMALVTAVGLWLGWNRTGRNALNRSSLSRLTNDAGLAIDPAVSADGKLLAYASDRADGKNLNVWIQQLESPGNAIQLTHEEADTRQPSFSPDGTQIVFRSGRDGGGIYVIPAIGGQATRIAAKGLSPHFSPDGQWIAYWSGLNATSIVTGEGGGHLYIVPAHGGEARRVAPDISAAVDPIWSPDSRHLLSFVSPVSPKDRMDLWLISITGEPSRPTGILEVLRRQGFSFGVDRLPHLSQWTRDAILFSASYDDAVSAWRMPVSNLGHSRGPAERLTFGTALDVSPVLAVNGDLIFAGLNLTCSIWSLPLDANSGRVTGELRKLTNGPFDVMPSISEDGHKLAFTASTRGEPVGARGVRSNGVGRFTTLQVRVKDLSTGKEIAVADAEGENQPLMSFKKMHPQISRDGTLVAYSTTDKDAIYVAQPGGESPRLLPGGARGYVWEWSRDNKRLLFSGEQDDILYQSDLVTGRQAVFLKKAAYTVFQPKFAPDGKALAFIECDTKNPGTECRTFVAKLAADGYPEAESWMEVDHPTPWDDKPRWAPDSRSIYFVSDRDGHFCLWMQRLNANKQPIGKPAAIYHFHDSRLAMINVGTSSLEIDVARDKIVTGLGELTGNIWRLRRETN